ncbi:hypothetical protein CI109_105018 [Kwoniella shandongensis]|uniref:Uncharacterized protein n=1 Tax=Kwoniella shandongensis TaxID=1734106 RepID=A0A5M6BX75_9TREE|nr:uncharacterized protein CI109_004383 [Kwoniella shandongensis]KAA5527323.1 hypothetical protein CI109_004383 [Kwoniella shandongensis]
MTSSYSQAVHGLAPPSPGHHHDTTSQSNQPSSSSSSTSPLRSPRLPPSPILLHPLPPTSSLVKESAAQSELELDRQTRQVKRERELAEALQDQAWSIERSIVREEQGTWSKSLTTHQEKGKSKQDGVGGVETKGFARPPQAYELYQAIDKHDIDYIMRVRDHAFSLLLQKNGAEFPIVYASRIGPGHRDVVILLVGALSRYVNHLEPEDFDKKETKDILKALRANLKLAIDHSLHSSSPHLLSSYLQVLIMSEGDSFLHKTIYDLTLILRDPHSHPVQEAESLIRRFCTKELRGVAGGVGEVEEYVANAALDLVIMAVWSLAAGQVGLDNLPTHTFARDLRTYQLFSEAMDDHASKLHKVTPRIRKMLKTLRDLAGETKKGVRGRLRDVAGVLDQDE